MFYSIKQLMIVLSSQDLKFQEQMRFVNSKNIYHLMESLTLIYNQVKKHGNKSFIILY
jgi:hypothetical protein